MPTFKLELFGNGLSSIPKRRSRQLEAVCYCRNGSRGYKSKTGCSPDYPETRSTRGTWPALCTSEQGASPHKRKRYSSLEASDLILATQVFPHLACRFSECRYARRHDLGRMHPVS